MILAQIAKSLAEACPDPAGRRALLAALREVIDGEERRPLH